MKPESLLRFAARCGWLALAITATAQTPPSRTESAEAKNEAIQLSPFTVSTDKDLGYLAANSLSGSRLNTPLIDTPASISEMTKEFLEDIAATDMMAAQEYAMGFQAERVGGNDNITQFNSNQSNARGLGRGTATRDFFSWGLSSDTFSVERLSFSRGPNSILYGVGSPGGVVNSMSKRAGFTTRSEVNLRVDENESWRFHIDHNQRLNAKLAFRANLLAEDMRTWRELEYAKTQRMHLAGTWRPFARTEIRADYERGVQRRLQGLRFSARDYFLQWIDAGRPAYDRLVNRDTYPVGVVSFGANPRLVYDGDASRWYNVQRFGQTRGRNGVTAGGEKLANDQYVPFTAPLLGLASTSDNDYWTGSVILQQEIVKNLYVELAVNRQFDQRTVFRSMSQDQLGVRIDPNLTLPGGAANPNFGQMFLEGQALTNTSSARRLNQRASVTYEWNPRQTWLGRHRWLAMGTDESSKGKGAQYNEANLTPLNPALPAYSNAQNTVNRRTYLNFNGGTRSYNQDPFRQRYPAVAFTDAANGLAGTITPGFFTSNLSPSNAENRAAMFAGQSNFWRDRIALTYGVRRDEATRQNVLLSRNVTTQEVTGVIWNPTDVYTGTTRTQGGVFHVTKWFSVFGNRSDNYTPQSALDVNGNNIGNVRGEGVDYGFKFRLAENKLYATVSRFKTSAKNQAARNFNLLTYIQGIWVAIEGATGEHVTKFTGSPLSNTDTQSTDADGYEFEVTANPLKGLSLTANYGTLTVKAANLYPFTRAHIATHRAQWAAASSLPTSLGGAGSTVAGALGLIDTNLAQDALQDGRIALHNYKHTFNVFGRYQFQDGRLKNWSVGTGARYRGHRVLGYRPSGEPVLAPKWFLMDANVAYRRPLWNKRVDLRVQLNVQNVLDNRDLIWALMNPTTFEKNDYTLFTPRLFTLTASFSYR